MIKYVGLTSPLLFFWNCFITVQPCFTLCSLYIHCMLPDLIKSHKQEPPEKIEASASSSKQQIVNCSKTSWRNTSHKTQKSVSHHGTLGGQAEKSVYSLDRRKVTPNQPGTRGTDTVCSFTTKESRKTEIISVGLTSL